MATSGSTDFSIGRDDIIKYALLSIQAIGQGDTPSSTQVNDASVMLNLIVKAWQADGMPLWALKQTSFPLTAATSFTIGVGQTIDTSRPLRVYSAFTRHSNIDTPITVITRAEYDLLSAKTETGTPTQLYYDPQGGATAYGTIYLWPKPDTDSIANRTCYITYTRPFEDFDASTDTPDFPQEWYLPLTWMLAAYLGPSYGVPLAERKQLMLEAEGLHQQALHAGAEEGSVFMQPNRRA
jgi:hypothetical protein